ncbi:hypothetical protein TRFO_38080 [Tritrichomonas foetus]|uniref:Protein kinase domain-containing protein n=1 Tax=Tritrichomonas foetus TaxID=1144522 RepID=A0A1J4JEB6_9EUKA|nr:hypothetical protein TRFO_38080 [Tritrichomonas foetus]|eukprot:OHS95781.1 hypothetical protein TRFO_38080 [Tritrichomonas foetus]
MTEEFPNELTSNILINPNNYEVGDKIKEMCHWSTYKAVERNSQTNVFFHVLHYSKDELNEKSIDLYSKKSLIRAIKLIRKYNFPGIAKTYGVYFPEADDQNRHVFTDSLYKEHVIVVSEYFEKNLEKLARDFSDGKPTPGFGPTERSKIIFGISSILENAHAYNLTHQRLNLSNIYLNDNFEPIIGEFGMAYMLPECERNDYKYLAPEVKKDSYVDYSIPVDVYAFACIVYRMFSYEMTSNNNNEKDFFFRMKIMKGWRPDKPAIIPNSYWNLIIVCWEQSSISRPQFSDITNMIIGDEFVLHENGIDADVNDLKRYQEKMLAFNHSFRRND